MQIEKMILSGCRRLATKGLLQAPHDSFSLRIPGEEMMLFATGLQDWREIQASHIRRLPFRQSDTYPALHAPIYSERGDVGAIALSSPRGVGMLAGLGGVLPTLFDEQARHIGGSTGSMAGFSKASTEKLRQAFRRGENAALFGTQLLCLGMTCDRVLFNSELVEKCAQAYVIARASGRPIRPIPWWVRLIARHRLIKDERTAALSYLSGQTPENVSGY